MKRKCSKCHINDIGHNKTYCHLCYLEWQRQHYRKMIKEGRCPRCKQINDRPGKVECSKCAISNTKRAKYQEHLANLRGTKRGKETRAKHRQQVFNAYGNQCACCGETEKLFLTIDHVNNDGAKHRKPSGGRMKGDKLHNWLISNNFPSQFQILCWNCNCGKYLNSGICPHKKLKEVIGNDNERF